MTRGQDAVHDALQKHMQPAGQAILTGWAVVSEWVDPSGERWLSKGCAPGTTGWAARGMLHDALYRDDWDEDDNGGTT